MIKYAVNNPVKVFVVMCFVFLFGLQALFNMPYRLIPNIDSPQISVSTYWRGASPFEIEKEIIEVQERVLKRIPGLVDIESSARQGSSYISLMFDRDIQVNEAMLLVSNQLNEITGYPDNVLKPTIRTASTDSASALEMMLLTDENNPRSIEEYLSFFEETIKPYFDRVKGVADVSYWGGRAKQIHIEVDPYKLSAYNLTLTDFINVLKNENINISAGTVDFGAKDYRFRTLGEVKTPDDLRNLVIVSSENAQVKLGDLAHIDYGYSKRNTIVRHGNTNALFVDIIPQAGANILDLTDELEKVVSLLNNSLLKNNGLKLVKISDQKTYILNAISLVKSNIIAGGILAIIVLLLFLRSIRSTLVIATTIPICILGTFLIMHLLGKSLNVISLAGIAFSVGMLIDNSIVVLENIDRHMKMGKTAVNASIQATKEVWGAIVASTLTTIAVFIPIVFLKEEAGQLFGDIAIAVSAAVGFSLFTSISVIPVLTKIMYSSIDKKREKFKYEQSLVDLKHGNSSNIEDVINHENTEIHNYDKHVLDHKNKLIKKQNKKHKFKIKSFIPIHLKKKKSIEKAHNLYENFFINRYLLKFGGFFVNIITNISDFINSKFIYKLSLVVVLTVLSFASVYYLIPKMDYLPLGNKNAVYSVFTPPPGISYEERKDMGNFIYKNLKPYIDGEKTDYPKIENYVYVASPTYVSVTLTSTDEKNVSDLIPLLSSVTKQIPGVTASTAQSPMFNIGRGSSNTFLMNVAGAMEYSDLLSVVRILQERISVEIPEIQIRVNPTTNPVYPEVQIIPDREALKATGITTNELGLAMDVYLDGRKIGQFKDPTIGNIDIMLQGENQSFKNPNDVYSILVNSKLGMPVPASSISSGKEVLSVDRIRRYNYQRSFLFIINLPKGMVLEQLKEQIDTKVINPMREEGLMTGITIYTSGASSKLEKAKEALSDNFILAILITYLLMAALLNNFFYPLIIMFSVPLAASGGFIGLDLVNRFLTTQNLDVITMLGFIMLIGSVVNNPILIVYQTLNNIKYGLSGKAAISYALKTRIRPIFMSTTTSIFGMLPLVIAPGAGSELYRGMGSVILGGMIVSTIFTLFLIPALLSFFLNKVEGSDKPVEEHIE